MLQPIGCQEKEDKSMTTLTTVPMTYSTNWLPVHQPELPPLLNTNGLPLYVPLQQEKLQDLGQKSTTRENSPVSTSSPPVPVSQIDPNVAMAFLSYGQPIPMFQAHPGYLSGAPFPNYGVAGYNVHSPNMIPTYTQSGLANSGGFATEAQFPRLIIPQAHYQMAGGGATLKSCFSCGKPGHKAAACPQHQKRSN
ncbi:hypothetical protein Ciccas_004128 [Cichlidogyrus casuarinus]|uniref:CCHC-type domain-containing protein n=1 Tax=Cichlidogyrus casuarinus TaxID=1844966 RepID=A0ABD2QDA9_9PLAT